MVASHDRGIITHGAWSGVERVREFLRGAPSIVEIWSRQLELDVGDPKVLTRLSIQSALQSPVDIVVFSSTKHEHIRENVAAAADLGKNAERISRFSQLARDVGSASRSQARVVLKKERQEHDG
jgi:hypothetical protein